MTFSSSMPCLLHLPLQVCKGGLGNLPGLDMQDPAHAFTTYPADPIGSMFDMGMHTNFCQAPTLPNSFDTNGKTSQQSTSDSYDIMSYPQASADCAWHGLHHNTNGLGRSNLDST